MNVRLSCRIALATLGLCALAACACKTPPAEPPKPAATSMMQKMDTNGDGRATREEFTAFFVARFKVMDANGDGKLSREEFSSALIGLYKAMDVDGDGKVSLRETLVWYAGGEGTEPGRPAAAPVFKAADLNADGMLTDEEFRQLARAVFAAWDADADGVATLTEMRTHIDLRFKAADLDGDGYLSMDEFLAHWTGEPPRK